MIEYSQFKTTNYSKDRTTTRETTNKTKVNGPIAYLFFLITHFVEDDSQSKTTNHSKDRTTKLYF